MHIVFDFNKLGNLLSSFYAISGVRYSLVDSAYNVIFASSKHSEFCGLINNTKEGHARCVACDTKAAKQLTPASGPYTYRCHAGAFEVVLPVKDKGQIIGFIFFGQMLRGEESLEQQWESARKELAWFGDLEALREAYFQLKLLNMETIHACSTILEACSSYIELQGVIKAAMETEIQRVNAYIDANYAFPVTLKDVSAALSMSKTKLCGITAKHNTTFTKLLCSRRMDAAKTLLLTTDLPIAEIAGMVGISDYNYFTKLFRNTVGVTPRKYRKAIGGAGAEAEETLES